MTEGRRTDDSQAPDEANLEIERTRAAIQQDIRAIGEKFSPSALKEQAKGVLSDAKREGADMIRETKDKAVETVRAAGERAIESAQEVAHELGDRARRAGHRGADYARRGGEYARRAGVATGDFVTDNAVPLSLIGIGVGWLALSMRRQRAARHEDDFSYRGFAYAGYEEDYPGAEDYTVERGNIRPRHAADVGARALDRAEGVAHAARERAEGMAHAARERAEGMAHAARERAEGMAHAARERVDDVAESARELAHRARESVGVAAETARDRVGALAERATHGMDVARTRVGDAASELGHQARELSHETRERLARAQRRTRDFADENPLAVGAIALAAGVGVGLLLPATQPENRLMGSARDRLVGDARGLLQEVRDTGSRVGETARDAAREVKDAAREVKNTVADTRISH